jgi:hypothetical protein
LRLEPGTYEFTLGNLKNYEPESREVEVGGTTVLQPLTIVFTRNET